VELAGEARDGLEAVAWLLAHEVDVVFLDVKMPRCGGFEVVEHVGVERMPLVVFATAHDEHALRAFEVAAVDYLLKPFARERLRAVLARVRARLGERRAARSAALARAMTAASPPPFLTRLLVERAPGREVLLELARVSFVRAAGNYLEFHADGATYLRRGTLSALEARLDPATFLRLNRSELVRLAAVREFQPWYHGDWRALLHDGHELAWSRRYRALRPDLARGG
ncbi:MAG: LytTR family DNA-binding domain-containing protein, partial [Planctomycetota bacterium]